MLPLAGMAESRAEQIQSVRHLAGSMADLGVQAPDKQCGLRALSSNSPSACKGRNLLMRRWVKRLMCSLFHPPALYPFARGKETWLHRTTWAALPTHTNSLHVLALYTTARTAREEAGSLLPAMLQETFVTTCPSLGWDLSIMSTTLVHNISCSYETVLKENCKCSANFKGQWFDADSFTIWNITFITISGFYSIYIVGNPFSLPHTAQGSSFFHRSLWQCHIQGTWISLAL